MLKILLLYCLPFFQSLDVFRSVRLHPHPNPAEEDGTLSNQEAENISFGAVP